MCCFRVLSYQYFPYGFSLEFLINSGCFQKYVLLSTHYSNFLLSVKKITLDCINLEKILESSILSLCTQP